MYAPVASRGDNLFSLLPAAAVLLDEPDQLAMKPISGGRRSTPRLTSLVGNLVRPEDLYLSPEHRSER